MSFKEIKAEDLQFNPFTRIGSDWMLITAGDEKKFNTMTASWSRSTLPAAIMKSASS